MNPSLEASWRHPWRQDLHTGAFRNGSGGVLMTLHREDAKAPPIRGPAKSISDLVEPGEAAD
ncbi:hypothetical protein [Halorhodospira halochloris]|uniref:hypothetical protein n=1 Tax=Halorhodospira halochloris TaxID=1052 RepID=UPI00076F7153|nr:hypothetical protein [Halorhodospira halochloris]